MYRKTNRKSQKLSSLAEMLQILPSVSSLHKLSDSSQIVL